MSEYELWQDGMKVASVDGPEDRARREIEHYAMMYGQDGLVKVYGLVVNEKGKRQRVEVSI